MVLKLLAPAAAEGTCGGFQWHVEHGTQPVIFPAHGLSLSCPAASKEDRSAELTAEGPGTDEASGSSGEESEEESEEDDGLSVPKKAKQAAGRLRLGCPGPCCTTFWWNLRFWQALGALMVFFLYLDVFKTSLVASAGFGCCAW